MTGAAQWPRRPGRPGPAGSRVADVLLGRRRDHPVDDGGGKRDCLADPFGELRPEPGGDLGDPRPEEAAVVGDVVERRPRPAASCRRRVARARARARRPGAERRSVRPFEVIGGDVVALLGDRQGDERRRGCAQRGQRRGCTRWRPSRGSRPRAAEVRSPAHARSRCRGSPVAPVAPGAPGCAARRHGSPRAGRCAAGRRRTRRGAPGRRRPAPMWAMGAGKDRS